MTRRNLKKRIAELEQTSATPPTWWRRWAREHSDEWRRGEWETITREAAANGRTPEAQAWARGLTEDDAP